MAVPMGRVVLKKRCSVGALSAQLSLFRERGGKRAGAGRRARSGRRGVPHRARPKLSRHHPVHVTLRARAGLESLRKARIFREVRGALRAARERAGFRLVHFSVQGNHIHLLAEAEDRIALSRGLQGLAIRVAFAVNRALARRGPVFSERYHARALRTPLEVRRALLYVLKNYQHHLAASLRASHPFGSFTASRSAPPGVSLPPWHLDDRSSAPHFDGWRPSELLLLAQHRAARATREPCTLRARTFLLRVGWQRHGLLSLDEDPA
jgi:REP element-mobilizing transposase RayT